MKTQTFAITYSNGHVEICESLAEAKELILSRNPGAAIYDYPERSLAWESDEDSIDDDGHRAVAEIRGRE